MQLAPMIDVIMFLLTFFFVTWNLSRYELDKVVKTPTATRGKPAKSQAGEIVLNIRKSGEITLNRRVIGKEELENTLKELAVSFPDQTVVIRCDGEVEYKHLMNVLDICNAAGLQKIAFAGARPENKPVPAATPAPAATSP